MILLWSRETHTVFEILFEASPFVPVILIRRTGVPSSPFLPLSLGNTHGFPPHTFSFFFCHFHFTKLGEGFGNRKERKQNKTRRVSRNAKMGKPDLGILFYEMRIHFISSSTNLPFFFLLMHTQAVLFLTQDAPAPATLVDLWTAVHRFGPERTSW